MKFLRLAICFLLFAQFSGCTLFDDLDDDGIDVDGGKELVIAYAQAPATYSPLTYDAASRKYLANIYEPLVRYDRSFNFKTGLAVSWGRLDDLTWDFKLRDGVKFHDGGSFEADDAVYSLEMAMGEGSGLYSLLENIDHVEQTEDLRMQIVTKEPDPLLLHKLTNVFMMKWGWEDFDSPLGTGPYVLVDFEDWDMILTRFGEYWGPTPFYQEVKLSYVPDPDDRMAKAFDEEIQFLANVPPQYADDLESYGMRLSEVPSLELSFLMFNTYSVFGDEDLRQAAWHAISTTYAEELGGGYLKPADQYAASGIFGSVTDVEKREVDFALASEHRELYRNKYSGPVEITLDVPWGLDVLGDAIALDLAAIDIDVTVNVLEASELEKKILAGESDFYFFGWKYDLADASDFFVSVVHSPDGVRGGFNGIGYENKIVDGLIENVAYEFDPAERQLLFEDLVGQLSADRVIMPLFESKLLYGIGDSINWDIRLDGQVLASEIVSFVVE
jgi:peptide/nickel transport system substrate-binding protein